MISYDLCKKKKCLQQMFSHMEPNLITSHRPMAYTQAAEEILENCGYRVWFTLAKDWWWTKSGVGPTKTDQDWWWRVGMGFRDLNPGGNINRKCWSYLDIRIFESMPAAGSSCSRRCTSVFGKGCNVRHDGARRWPYAERARILAVQEDEPVCVP